MNIEKIESARRRLLACVLDAQAAQDRADAAKRTAEQAAARLADLIRAEGACLPPASYNRIDAAPSTG